MLSLEPGEALSLELGGVLSLEPGRVLSLEVLSLEPVQVGGGGSSFVPGPSSALTVWKGATWAAGT